MGKRKKPTWGDIQDFDDYVPPEEDLNDLEDGQAFLEEVEGAISKLFQKTHRRERHQQKQHPKRQEHWL